MPIPDIAVIGDAGHVQDHNDIIGVLQEHDDALDLKAPLASPTFTGTVVLPSSTSIGDVTNTEISYLDGVTSAIQTQINSKASLDSPSLSGTPTAPTASTGTSTTQIATTAFVQAAVSSGGGAYQAYDEDLNAIASLTGTSGLLKKTAANTWSLDTSTYALNNQTMYIGTTEVSINRGSSNITLNGTSIDGNAGTVTDGVYTTGSYSDPSWLTLSKSKVGLGNVENTALSTWTGSSNITTLGTVSTGVWSGTAIGISKGGTGLTSTPTNGQILIGNGTGFSLATITAGSNITVTNSTGGITIASTASGGTPGVSKMYMTTVTLTFPQDIPWYGAVFPAGSFFANNGLNTRYSFTSFIITLPSGTFSTNPYIQCTPQTGTPNNVNAISSSTTSVYVQYCNFYGRPNTNEGFTFGPNSTFTTDTIKLVAMEP
jgi:hypothetical protein